MLIGCHRPAAAQQVFGLWLYSDLLHQNNQLLVVQVNLRLINEAFEGRLLDSSSYSATTQQSLSQPDNFFLAVIELE